MGGAVALGERLRLVGAMIEAPRQLLDVLMQGTAQRYVQLLEAAADREQRHRALEGAPDQRQGCGVAGGIAQALRARRRSRIVVGLDVRRAAGDQEAVEPIQHRIRLEARPKRWDDQRHRAGAIADGLDVLGADLMVAEAVALNEAGRNTDERVVGLRSHGSVVAERLAANKQGAVAARCAR